MEISNSSSSTIIPDVYIFDCDNEAEPYWQIMVVFSNLFLNYFILIVLSVYFNKLEDKIYSRHVVFCIIFF